MVRDRLARYRLLALVSLLWFLVQAYRFAFPPLFDTLQSEYAVSSAETGFLFSIFLAGYAVMQFPGGRLADRFGEHRVIAVGGACAAVAVLGVAVAPTFAAIVGAAGAIGLTTGGHKTVAINYLSRVYPSKCGRALGVMDTIGISGGLVAPLLVFVTFLLTVAWQAVFVVLGVAGLGLTAAFVRWGEGVDRPADDTKAGTAEASESTLQSYTTAFTDSRLSLFSLVAILFTFFYNGVITFLPAYLTTVKGFSSGVATILYGVLFVGAAMQVATGELGDRFGRAITATTLLGSSLVGICVLLVSMSAVALGVAIVFLGIGIHGFRPVRDAYLAAIIPERTRGGTLGLVRLGMTSVGAVAPAAVGLLIARAGHTIAFVLLGLLSGGVLLISAVVVSIQRTRVPQ